MNVMAGVADAKRAAHRLLDLEQNRAWDDYLDTTRDVLDPRYREVEPWAWARLQQQLRAIARRRARISP